MKIKLLVLAIALCLSAAPAMADMVTYDMGIATLDFTQATNNLLVQETSLSMLYLEFDDLGGVALDNVAIIGGDNFNLTLDLTMNQLGINNWSASGSLKFTDTDATSNAVEAAVQSYSVKADGTSLQIVGSLSPQNPPPSILVNRGDPWVFVGNTDGGGADADLTANQITVFNPESYDGGTVWTIKFGMTDSLDVFFGTTGQDRHLTGGEVKGSVVPVPAAVLLGILGLGVVGLKLRKYA